MRSFHTKPNQTVMNIISRGCRNLQGDWSLPTDCTVYNRLHFFCNSGGNEKMPKAFDKGPKVTYPSGCKELSEDLSKDELLKRLKALARAFQDMSQDPDDNIKELALYLASEFFMDHPNRDVKCLIACCIADIFRIFAPEAPYTDPEHLKEIFLFLTRQLKGLEDPDAPSFKRYFYLLENLAWVKSFNICLELEDNQEIFCEMFKLIFNIINEKHSNKVVNFMLDMMSPLLSESDTVSQDLLDILLVNIIEPNKSNNRPAYNLAKDLIRRTANALEPYIQTFFNNLLMLGKTSESDLSGRLFDLIYELNMISSSVLLAVLPQLEFKLKSSDKRERKSVTKLLSKMFSDPESQLAVQNRPLWICFLGRFKDIELEVRKICVMSCQDFLINHPELVQDISEALRERCHDTDETVRMDVIQSIIGAGKKDFSCISDALLQCLKDRTLDKKYHIRKEALMGLGAIYKKLTSIDDLDKSHVERICWVKNKVLYGYYQNSVEDRILVERILNMSLVPYSLEAPQRMKKLLHLYSTVDEHAVKAINELFKTQMNVRSILGQLLELQEHPAIKSGENKEVSQQISARITALARILPDFNKGMVHMKEFNERVSKDQKMKTSLSNLLAPACTCKKAGDYVKEILQKCGKCVSGNLFYSNVKTLLERVAPVMIDYEAVEAIVFYLDDAINGLNEITDEIPDVTDRGMKLLYVLSHVYSGAFESEGVYSKLISFVKHNDDTVADVTIQIFTNVGKDIEVNFSNIYSSLMPVLKKLVKIGTPKQSKHAIQCIAALCKRKEVIFMQIFEHLQKNMELDSPNFLTSLVAIGHMTQLCPEEFSAPVTKLVTQFIVKQLLMKDEGKSRTCSDSWYGDHLVSDETQAKVQALKLMVRWLLGIRDKETNSASSTLRLLHTLIVHEGDLMESGKINKAEMARLRLQAGCCMLKLAQESIFETHVTLEYFQALAMLINDQCYQVRTRFAQKLHKGLITLRLPLQYMSIFCLAANDPIKDRRTQVKNYLVGNIRKRREYLRTNTAANAKLFSVLPDYVLPYTIHLLAHDPDLKSFKDVPTLKNIKDCLWFIMEPLISKNENYSYSFYRKLIENIKQTKDAQCPDVKSANEKLYSVCDLALTLVMTKSTNLILKDFPAEPVLPAKLFTSPDKNYSNTKLYLPEELRAEAMKHKKFAPGYIPSATAPTAVKSSSGNSGHQVVVSKPKSASSVSSAASSPERPMSEIPSPGSSPSEASPPITATKGRGGRRGKVTAELPSNNSSASHENQQVQRRGRAAMAVKSKQDRSSEQRDSSEESTQSSPAESKKSKVTTKRGQGKITDYVTRGSMSPLNKENKPSKANTSKKQNTRVASVEKSGQLSSRGASVRDSSPVVSGKRKRASSVGSSTEASPAKISKQMKGAGTQRRNTRQMSSDLESEASSVRTTPRKAAKSLARSSRSRGKTEEVVPSPSSPSSAAPTPKKQQNKPTKTQTSRANVRQGRRLMNGTSDGEDTPDSKKSTPSPSKRRVAALAKEIEKQTNKNVKKKTRKTGR